MSDILMVDPFLMLSLVAGMLSAHSRWSKMSLQENICFSWGASHSLSLVVCRWVSVLLRRMINCMAGCHLLDSSCFSLVICLIQAASVLSFAWFKLLLFGHLLDSSCFSFVVGLIQAASVLSFAWSKLLLFGHLLDSSCSFPFISVFAFLLVCLLQTLLMAFIVSTVFVQQSTDTIDDANYFMSVLFFTLMFMWAKECDLNSSKSFRACIGWDPRWPVMYSTFTTFNLCLLDYPSCQDGQWFFRDANIHSTPSRLLQAERLQLLVSLASWQSFITFMHISPAIIFMYTSQISDMVIELEVNHILITLFNECSPALPGVSAWEVP